MDSKYEPDFKPFRVIKIAKDIIHLAQNHFQMAIVRILEFFKFYFSYLIYNL